MQQLPTDLLSEIIGHVAQEERFILSHIYRNLRQEILNHLRSIEHTRQFGKSFQIGDVIGVVHSRNKFPTNNNKLFIELASKSNSYILTSLLIRKKMFDGKIGSYRASRDGSLQLIELITKEKLVDLNSLTKGVYERGELMHLIKGTGLSINNVDIWENALIGACKGGHVETIEELISKDVYRTNLPMRREIIRRGFRRASSNNRIDVLQFLIENQKITLSSAREIICLYGGKLAIKWMMDRGSPLMNKVDWEQFMIGAAKNNCIDWLELALKEDRNIDLDRVWLIACQVSSIETIQWFINRRFLRNVAYSMDNFYQIGLRQACTFGRCEVVKFLITLDRSIGTVLHECIIISEREEYMDLVELLKKHLSEQSRNLIEIYNV